MNVRAYVLAGGSSTRYGRDKARAVLEGTPLLVHAARSVASVARETTVVASAADLYADLGFRTIADHHPGEGPLAGVETALTDARRLEGTEAWIVVTACDWLGLRSEWVERLVRAARAPDEDPARVIAFRDADWEPLPALYHTEALAVVEAHLSAERRALRALIDALPSRALPLPAEWSSARQVNRPPA